MSESAEAPPGQRKASLTTSTELEDLVLSLWRKRSEKGAIVEITGKLQGLIKDPSALDAVEFYLPQFAHMIIQLGDDLPDAAALEKFVLAVCQMSIHVALQFFWIVYASLQEHRPKTGGNRSIYTRCARLLLRLEQCVAYGVSASTDRSSGQTELMDECAKMAAESMSEGTSSSDEAVYAGQLHKKGGGTSKLGRKSWHLRYFEVRQRVLYYYVSEEMARRRSPKGSIYLASAELVQPQSKHEHYFEVHCKQSDLSFQLRAQGPEQLKQWLQVLRAVMLLPEPPGMSTKELKDTYASYEDKASLEGAYTEKLGPERLTRSSTVSSDEIGVAIGKQMSERTAAGFTQRYEYFSSQRDFVRRLTDLAETLRAMQVEERQGALQPALTAMPLPPMTFFPLGLSSAPMLKVLRFAPFESIVFHTKARCPLMLFLEVQELQTSVADAMRSGSVSLLTNGGAAPTATTLPTDTAPDVTARKREGWAAKVERIGGASELKPSTPGWKLTSMFVKSNDDLRQEVFVMQMIAYCQRIFPQEHSWFASYHIQATGPDTGLIETITSAQDLDRLKKAPGYTTLRALFESRYGAPDGAPFKEAQARFSKSLAAYSILMWILLLRDRHNANLMLDDEGRYFHVDFGFVLGHSTGKGIGGMVENSAFKLTNEYIEVLDGLGSDAYNAFCTSCVENLRAARAHGETICTLVEIVGTNSVFPCFQVVPVRKVMPQLRKRLCLDIPDAQFEAEARRIVSGAAKSKGSANYDFFQNLQRGIAV